MSKEQRMMKAARRAVADACAVCRAVQRDIENVRSVTKDDRSPVTVADFASQAVIVHRLREALGEIRLVGEEDSAALRRPGAEPLREKILEAVRLVWPEATDEAVLEAIDAGGDDGSGEAFWTLDPIDGTKGFLRGEQYAVSLAWIEGKVPTLGLMGCPNLPMDFSKPFDAPDPKGAIYVAALNDGLYEVAADEPDERMRQVPRLRHAAGDIVRVCESVESGHSKHEHSAKILERVGRPTRFLRLDSQAKYAVVARGQADAYLRMPTRPGYREKIWDHAAGALVAVEAGIVVTDITGSPLDFSHGSRLEENRGIVCATPDLHRGLIDAIEALGYAGMGLE